MSDSLTLARRLGALDDGALAGLLVRRQVATRDVRDFFDLADALLEPSSVRPALRAVDRTTLEFLAGAGAAPRDPASLYEAALAHPVEEGTAVYDAVATAAAAVLQESAAPSATPHPPTAPDAHPTAADRAAAAERAFTVLSAVSELGQQLRLTPVRIRARGGVSATDDKKLATVLGVDASDVGALVELATAARLVTVDADILVSTTAADEWNLLSPGHRWLELARAWLAEQEEPYRRALGSAAPEWSSGAALRAAFAGAFPAADAAMTEHLEQLDRVAALLGAAIDGRSTGFGRAALDPTDGSAAASLDAELPAEVGQVYLQHDLSVIAPGPLSPTVDSRLRKLADIETRGVASAYRISQQSIDRALASGETASSLREFLGEISLTGLPQAVDYLIGEGARRHGLVRVRHSDDPDRGPRTVVHTTDAALLGAIAVDQSLSPLGLRRELDGALWTRVDSLTVYWMLADARYPVLAEDVNGEELVLRRSRIAAPSRSGAGTGRADAVSELVLRLRSSSAQSADDTTAWMTRLLDKAVRARTPMTIDVRMPDDRTTQLQVTPLSLQNGRLRCVDVRAGVERTVPVANIVAVTAS